jgi:hypothetical protein
MEVWPWSLLVPWMEADMHARKAIAAAACSGGSALEGTPLDPYDNPLAMPLAQFVDAPIVAELLHNGAALQVRGGKLCRSSWPCRGALRYG